MEITRRDFLSGSALAIGAGLTPLGQGALAHDAPPAPYPPALTGLRGAHAGAFETAHALAREGKTFPIEGLKVEERHDLVVVGAGLAGLSAAWFYRQKKPDARILILDNHDDFGGHARRNEFSAGGRMLLGYGGSESMVDPKNKYASDAHKALLKALKIDADSFLDNKVFDRSLYPGLGLSRAVFFDKESFGADRLVTGDPNAFGFDEFAGGEGRRARPAAAFLADCPLSDGARAGLLALYEGRQDYLPGASKEAKLKSVKSMSYRDFILKTCALPKDAADFFQGRSNDNWGYGVDIVAAFDAFGDGYPGAEGLGLKADLAGEDDGPYVHHFPDGNASLARGIVRSLIPGVAPNVRMRDLAAARFDYAKLDNPRGLTRIRLNATVVLARNEAGAVTIGYVQGNTTHRLAARHCIVASYGMIMPHIVPELPAAQKQALASNVKSPLVYTKVAIRNWQAWQALGVHDIAAPMGFHSRVKLDFPVSYGGYQFPHDPAMPIGLHMVHVPLAPGRGLDVRTQSRIGRQKLLEATFAQYEERIRSDLDRMLGPGGFDAKADILGITVNRWPHGYSYYFNRLFDDLAVSEATIATARARSGNITLANSDTAFDPYAHSAIGEAARAVAELLGG